MTIAKDSPGVGDVHVATAGQMYLPEPGRSKEDIEAERVANLRPGVAGAVEKGFSSFFKVAGVDEGLGLVFGWGIVCKEGGVDYYDVQKNHIPEDAMVEAVTDFMKGNRMAGEQHVRMDAGAILHSFPLTTDIAKAMGIETAKTGWMVACAPDKAMLAKFKSGDLTGFSIGGEHIEIDGKPVEIAA